MTQKLIVLINKLKLINGKCGYRLNEMIDENKIGEMMQRLFDKTNSRLEEKTG